ncbi:hypothetical protein [Actinoplanes sp. NBRC 103695]|uniref:hypothetical protein n=1 Tax=Actinoplanes sp. NBRC 103695 TaxID=3032202 RepID=UPI0024A23647|nr:hypothetical protein [Actinoplanes sp. NBRC 103695]GLY97446.1 hypothetical protein Acsp02_47000 [Actinoplanes sp. NBRC 103695]
MESARRFGPDFVSAHQAKYAHRRRSDRQLTYDIAVSEEYEPWRRWLDDQVALLPARDADAFARNLWLDEHHWPSIFELAAGAALRGEGYDIAYERRFEGLTPDWTVLNWDGSPAMFVEVHTDQPAKETFGRIRGWHVLDQYIAKIPVGVVVALVDRTNVPLRPPDARTAKKIVEVLRSRLLGSARTSSVDAHGYRFVVLADRFGPMTSPNAPYAFFAAPSGIAGAVDATRLTRAVEGKVRRYRALADHYDVPLVVAVGAHRFTGVDLSDVDRLLAGEPTVTFQFNLGDTFIGKHQFDPGHPARWSMPAGLSGLLWLHNQPPFEATIRPNPDAVRPMSIGALTGRSPSGGQACATTEA